MMMLLAGAGRGRAFGHGLPGSATPGSGRSTPGGALPATSNRLAGILNTNPVVVRRIEGQLARAGLICVHRGPGGAELTRSADRISLDEIFAAVHGPSPRPLLPLHAPSASAGIGGGHDAAARSIPAVLSDVFREAELSFRDALARVSLGSLVRRSVPAEVEQVRD